MDTANTIKNARLALNLTQTELGRLLGATQIMVHRWEYGKIKPRKQVLSSLQLLLWLDTNHPTILDRWIEINHILGPGTPHKKKKKKP